MRQFRILTNGHAFKVQELVTIGVFRKKPRWSDLGQYMGYEGSYFVATEYKTRRAAQKQINEWSERETIKGLSWSPV